MKSKPGILERLEKGLVLGAEGYLFELERRGYVEEGADFIIAETMDYLGEALIALSVIKETGLPTMINFGSIYDRTKDGIPFEESCQKLEVQGADIVGLNCSRGPRTMLPMVAQVREAVSCYVAALPVAYRTTEEAPSFTALRDEDGVGGFPIALDPFQVTRAEMALFARQTQEIGVNYVGICCGGAPHHVRAMAEALGRTVPASRYSPDQSLHPTLGTHVQERDVPFLKDWKE